MNISLPEFALVVLIGVSGSGKSTFARNRFLPTEVLSSDSCRGLVSDDENDQAATGDAFEVLHYIAAKRLKNKKLTVIDATNVQRDARKSLIELARTYHALPIAIVLDVQQRVAADRNRERPDRNFGKQVIGRQQSQLRRSLKGLKREGFRRIFHLKGEEEIERATIERRPLWNDRRHDHGPFDIIGDVHGCFDELVLLLETLGYSVDGTTVTPPAGRKAVFLGDLVDRGPKTPEVLELVMAMVEKGDAICIPGNHDVKLQRALAGGKVQRTHGLAESLEQLDRESPAFREAAQQFIRSLVSHYVLDDGKLVVAHAGLTEALIGRASGKVRDFALYGETTGETDEFGLPVRHNWAMDYRGRAMVVYGHTPVPEAEWLNGTINIDTGCVFGGNLTALRYPEEELISVEALQQYSEPVRPLRPDGGGIELSMQQQHDDVLDINDVTGKRIIDTRLRPNITVREENGAAALEVMSRHAVDPKWLIYLPPTMSPSETSALPAYLEHPAEVFEYYRRRGITQVICQEKHMGSRAMIVLCRDDSVARERFGVVDGSIGTVYTRTGRPFFKDDNLAAAFLARLRDAASEAGLWKTFESGWVVLDAELMPWSAKAQQLIQSQYAAVGSAARGALQAAIATLERAAGQAPELAELADRYRTRQEQAERYIRTYRQYCWPVASIADLKLAPFHLLATEGNVHVDKDHRWHMERLADLCAADGDLLQTTQHRTVDLTHSTGREEGIAWWEEMTARGSEGMVIKPIDFIARDRRGLLQPAIKCRGREYLRIIYGPEYTRPEHLERLKKRNLRRKRSLALREFALGVEALERFVRQEPLRRVHEAVFGVLALESEPVDPRL